MFEETPHKYKFYAGIDKPCITAKVTCECTTERGGEACPGLKAMDPPTENDCTAGAEANGSECTDMIAAPLGAGYSVCDIHETSHKCNAETMVKLPVTGACTEYD